MTAAAMNETGTSAGRPGDPCVMVIFGGSGDLTKRKLIPALYNLARDHFLAQEFAVVGIARRSMTHETFREKLTQDLKQFATGPVDPALWSESPGTPGRVWRRELFDLKPGTGLVPAS